MRGAAPGSQCSALVLFVGLFVLISTRTESEYQYGKGPSCTAFLAAVFPIYSADLGSQITGCRTEHNDVMEAYGNNYRVCSKVYSASVCFSLQYNCLFTA